MKVSVKHHYYLVTAVLTLNGGLAFGGSEWHEKYIARLPDGFSDDDLTQTILKFRQYAGATPSDSPGVIGIKDGKVFFTREKIKPTIAKQLIENKIIPQLAALA